MFVCLYATLQQLTRQQINVILIIFIKNIININSLTLTICRYFISTIKKIKEHLKYCRNIQNLYYNTIISNLLISNIKPIDIIFIRYL